MTEETMCCVLVMHKKVKAEVGGVMALCNITAIQNGHLSWKIKINGIDKPMGVG